MVVNVHRHHKASKGRGKGGKGVWRWGQREIIYLSPHYHHQNDSCIKMGSGDSHFNVLLIVRDKVTRQRPQTTTFLKRKESRCKIKPKSFCLLVLWYETDAVVSIFSFTKQWFDCLRCPVLWRGSWPIKDWKRFPQSCLLYSCETVYSTWWQR